VVTNSKATKRYTRLDGQIRAVAQLCNGMLETVAPRKQLLPVSARDNGKISVSGIAFAHLLLTHVLFRNS
jgi:hypothetical protein